ncbi:MAG: PTS IIA-like nitrogen regulatory protein PtsN [Beijerinckiaceae bacterium]
MPLDELLTRGAVMPSLKVAGKKQLLEAVAEQASLKSGISARIIFDALLQRERLGSTGIGGGIAIPHGKFEGLDQLFGIFARLDRPIDFEALDGEQVDLVFVLLAPEDAGADHLKGLSRVARLLRNPLVTARLRASRDADVIYSILTQPVEGAKAA